jgi:hypothetical protein
MANNEITAKEILSIEEMKAIQAVYMTTDEIEQDSGDSCITDLNAVVSNVKMRPSLSATYQVGLDASVRDEFKK